MVKDEPAPHRDPHQPLSLIGHDRQILPSYPSAQKENRSEKLAYRGSRYLPPRPEDLPDLIAALEIWTEDARSSELAVPVIAGLVHYQLATLHPFNNGNGVAACLCAYFILQRDGYSLTGFLTPEEQYAEDLDSYYRALNLNEKIDYYQGRADADLTSWLDYYIASMAKSCDAALGENGCLHSINAG